MAARRTLRWLVIALLVSGLFWWLAAAAGTAEDIPAVPGNPTRGRDVYVEKGCISCHSVRSPGSGVGPDLAVALVGKGIVGIAAAMINHYPGMRRALQAKETAPPTVTSGEMDDLIAFLLFINFAHEPGSVDNGRKLFSQKGCLRCHWLVGGGSIGPPLGRAMLSAAPITVAQEMWNHGTQMTAKMLELQVPRSTFEGHEMADLLAFLCGAAEPFPSSGARVPGDPVAGRELFQSKGCGRCHFKGTTGESIGPDLVTGHWYKTATEIAGAMWNHGPDMWMRMKQIGVAPARFADNEMGHVIAYLYLLHSAGGPGEPQRGRELFVEKECAHCHDVGGMGPALTAETSLDTPMHFAAAMWNHAPRMETLVTDTGLSWPVFAASDVGDLVSYLRERRAGQIPPKERTR